MGLSSYKDEARAANEGAKVELKDRRMLSARQRFKKQDSEQLQKLMEEQERIFELVSVHDNINENCEPTTFKACLPKQWSHHFLSSLDMVV